MTYDKKLSWKPHIQKAEGKARRKLGILRKLSGTTWGANEKILKGMYNQGIKPHLEYGSSAWSSASKSNLNQLDRIQNQALRIITGSMKSTPIEKMETITEIEPLQDARDTKIMLQAEKYLAKQECPMKVKLENLAKGQLKRSSFIHKAKKFPTSTSRWTANKCLQINTSP